MKEVTSLPPAVQALAEKLDAFGPSQVPNAIEPPLPLNEQREIESSKQIPNGLKMALYCAARSYNTGKPIALEEMVSSVVWRNWMGGALRTMMFLQSLGIKMRDENGKIVVEDMGQIDAGKMERNMVTGTLLKSLGEIFAEIQAYFMIPTTSETATDSQSDDHTKDGN